MRPWSVLLVRVHGSTECVRGVFSLSEGTVECVKVSSRGGLKLSQLLVLVWVFSIVLKVLLLGEF